jgi:dUTP pyrophosphatase
MSESVRIKFKRLNENLANIPLPAYKTEGSAGMDICAAMSGKIIVKSNSVELIPTNISVEIPEGFEIQVRPRSGLAAKYSIGLLNSPGTIDSDYRGEIKIILMNFGKQNFEINPGDRIAQLVLAKTYKADFIESEKLNLTNRGDGGFGHTGM